MNDRIGIALAVTVLATGAQATPTAVAPPSGAGTPAALLLAQSPRPVARPEIVMTTTATTDQAGGGFGDWLAAYRIHAQQQGIDGATLDRALPGLSYDAEVIRRDRRQSEFTKTIWDYLDTAVSDARVANGRKAVAANARTLAAIEAKYGVNRHIVAAIWGLESAYGSYRGTDSTLRSLATLAYDSRRGAFFEEQLTEALRILQSGAVAPENLRGSWAGAMGHTQFMPTSWRDHAVDFDGDGRRDIWGDDPADALASTAAYLKNHGWVSGQPWGVEVVLPEGFDHRQADRRILRTPAEWAALGVLPPDGRTPDSDDAASVLLPAGGNGAAFMIFGNFEVLESYNTADAYVIGVGHLADRIAGGPPIHGGWPRGDRALTYDERIELQERLTSAGFDTVKIDGRIGPLTIDAVRAYQVATGLMPDGYASPRLLDSLR
ncbi:lytic murein transglycosylase [Pukyongiella litopenaei]|uniref:Lytic murein transglycosylase n=1 Tax=Pukyongiella litopenaei TaxID=2605946 RepID=A0A2S0MRS3_9RHOB|nr:lytic murein transglycosylase [Pukyongiella litopenaei]AVO38572.1 lytic murein transglycosylase [Pukyongiella litopenaei]